MTHSKKTPYFHIETEELLGYVVSNGANYEAQTIFGYRITLTQTRIDAERTLEKNGQAYLAGVWQYYDADDRDWFTCVIKQALEQKVVVTRTNTLGYIEPDSFKQIVIEHPTEETFVKVS